MTIRTPVYAMLGAILLAACAAPAATDESPSAAASASVAPSASIGLDPTPVPHTVATEENPELRDELLAMMAEDQAVRTGIAPPGDDRTAEELFADWDATDARNQARMEEILDEHGWPGWSLVGEDGALAAWVIIQHADLWPELQERGLTMLMGAVEADDASPGDLAYLIDRVRVAKGLPQVYGTQVGADETGELAPRTPIEDPEHVDERRAAAGLGTLEEYYEELRASFESVAPSPSD